MTQRDGRRADRSFTSLKGRARDIQPLIDLSGRAIAHTVSTDRRRSARRDPGGPGRLLTTWERKIMGKGKGAGKSGDLLAGLERLQEQLRRAQEELAEQTVEAAAGGGAIRIVMSGTQECKSVRVSPELLRESEVEILQDLLLVAVNQAIRESRTLAARRLGPLAGGPWAAGAAA